MKGAPSVVDATRGAEITPLKDMSGVSSGASSMGKVITEGTFLRGPAPTYVTSPFGERYSSTKPRPYYEKDVLARAQVWDFSLRGYSIYGTVTLGDIANGDTLLQDWYPLTRDLAKRSLKYRHLPATLTNVDTLRWYLDAYHYLVANLAALLNLNRLPQYNAAFAGLTVQFPAYMSRITRLWRRASSHPMPPFLKEHAVRNGTPVFAKGVIAPTFRLWNANSLLPVGSGGPSPYIVETEVNELLPDAAQFGPFVYGLELVNRWLEVGGSDATVNADLAAVKDLIDMMSDVVPGVFQAGLPDPASMPGITSDPSVITDLIRRAVFRKDDVSVGTDRWIIFPISGQAVLGGLIPVCGFGAPTINDFTLLGAPKYGVFPDAPGANAANVDVNLLIPGTDHQSFNTMDITAVDARSEFGSTGTIHDEEMWVSQHASPGYAYSGGFGAFDVDTGTTFRPRMRQDLLRCLHPWDVVRLADRDAGVWASNEWIRMLDEVGYSYYFHMNPADLADNYAEFLASKLAIPFFK